MVFIICYLAELCQLHSQSNIDLKIDSLMAHMTIDEKIGQLNMLSADFPTGPVKEAGDTQELIKQGKIGAFLNASGAQRTIDLQNLAMKSRLKIPLLFAQDVLHGYRTVMPIPIAEACSWDLQAIENSARVAAIEASAVGLHWTFAPMVDICRDPRWGRVMEGAGEDPYLASLIATARVKGFQGKGLGHTDAVMACAKHFAAYGAAIGGRDYNSVDISLRALHEIYLPPFKAACEAGVASFMNAFNDLNGIPANGSEMLQRHILKEKWNFKGIIVSDWSSIAEMVNHGYSKNLHQAAVHALNAGCDMDMESRAYIQHLSNALAEKEVNIQQLNDAVRRILKIKFQLGLFDNPFKYSNLENEKNNFNVVSHHDHALDIARKSIVLLQNNDHTLPLNKKQRIALIGPLADSKFDHLGFWSYDWPDDTTRIKSLNECLSLRMNTKPKYANACGIDDSKLDLTEAIKYCNTADVIVIAVGEGRAMSGEARSRSNIHLPGMQEKLIDTLSKLGKPIVLVVSAGRPVILEHLKTKVDAIVFTWFLGMKAGEAIADVLLGQYNPSAKLVQTFPRSEGQIPIYYNHLNTGRPASNENETSYVSAYNDLPNSPSFAFGHGLSYSNFNYGKLSLSNNTIMEAETLQVSIDVENKSAVDGEEIIQLYIRDKFASVVRPIKELKKFQKEMIKGGKSKHFIFELTRNDFTFINDNLGSTFEEGEFQIMVGTSSDKVQTQTVYIKSNSHKKP